MCINAPIYQVLFQKGEKNAIAQCQLIVAADLLDHLTSPDIDCFIMQCILLLISSVAPHQSTLWAFISFTATIINRLLHQHIIPNFESPLI